MHLLVDILIGDILLETLFLELVKSTVFQRLALFLSLGKKREQRGNVSFGVLTAILIMITLPWDTILCHWVSSSQFQSDIVPLSSGSRSQRRCLLSPEDEGTMISQNLGYYYSKNAVSRPKILEFSEKRTLLRCV